MADANPSRLGQVNQAGDALALFLKVFSGEVLTAFTETAVTMDKHRVRTIASGKASQFPVTGKLPEASLHTPGAELLGLDMSHAERVISIDGLLVSHAFIANIDEAMNHYDVRSIYSSEIGRRLAVAADTHVLRTGILAARAAHAITGLSGGSAITDAAAATDGEVLASLIFQAAQKLDEKDVPPESRYVFLKPAQYNLLAQTTKVLNKDWNGSGSYSDGKVLKVADITIVKTNQLPTTLVNTGIAAYQGDFSKTVGLVMTQDAVGTVKLRDLAVESEYQIARQGTLMVGKYAMGHGILRAEAAVEIATP